MADVYKTPGSGPKEPTGRKIAMTPAEHYVMAEGLLEELVNGMEDGSLAEELGDEVDVASGLTVVSHLLAVAQVHATLASVDIDRILPLRKYTVSDGDQSFTTTGYGKVNYDRLGNKAEPEL